MDDKLIETFCRICLADNCNLINVFDEVEGFQGKLADMIESCGNLEVKSKFNLSNISNYLIYFLL